MPMPHIQLDDIRLYYEELGSGESILFLHGFTLDRRMWGGLPPFLSDAYRVILLDSRGHGLSDAPTTGYSRPERVNDLMRFIDALKIEKLHLVGLSMGGSLGLAFAFEHQKRLKSLTLVSTGAAGYNIGPKFSRLDTLAKEKGPAAVRAEWMRITMSWYKPEQAEIRKLMMTMIEEHSGAVWMDPLRGKYPPSIPDLEQAHKIKVPTCIFVGMEDKIFVPLSQQLHERIEGSILHEYEGIGHMLNLEAPERFNRDLKKFLSRVDAEPR
jgi:3-oxoadipate enol-lactonase